LISLGQAVVLQKYLQTKTKRSSSLIEGLFPKQREVFNSKAKNKTLVCGRRGGKTTTAIRLLYESAEHNPQTGEDESITLYIAPTKNQAKRLLWGRLQVVAKKKHIPMEFNATDLIAKHANGAQIWIMGADDDRDVDRMRGFAFRRAVIDEAQAVGADFEDLIDDVLGPALSDYDGDLILLGTPSAACIGFFYKASTGQLVDEDGNNQWENWSWTVLDNPMFPQWRNKENWQEIAKEWLDAKRRKKGWDEDNPVYQREWWGRWVRDDGGLVIKYNPSTNHYDELPTGHVWKHVIGMDLGRGTRTKKVQGVEKGNFAIGVWAFCEDLPNLYSVYQYKKAGLELWQWEEKFKAVHDQYRPIASVADCGALGAVIVSDMSRRLGIHIEAAEKKEKNAAIELMNRELAKGHVYAKKDSPWVKECAILQWNDDRSHEDPRYPNDLNDAQLYGYRKAFHWTYQEPIEIIRPGDDGYAEKIAENMKAARIKKMRKQKRRMH
jgi:hypothetical protein